MIESTKEQEKYIKSPRLHFLDGLRALAALWVLLGHMHLFVYGWNYHKEFFMWPLNILLYLHLAVVVFLVLSGFCLALPVVLNQCRIRTSASQYFKARALRILPPYYGALILILFVNFFVPLAKWGRHSAGLTQDIPWQVFLANFTLVQDFFPRFNTINGPFWSISTEWHLYFFFPFFIFILRSLGVKVFFLFSCCLAAFLTWLSFHPPAFFVEHKMAVMSPAYFVFLFTTGIVAAWFSFGENSEHRMKVFKWKIWLLFIICAFAFLMFVWEYRIFNGDNFRYFFKNVYKIDPLFGVVTALLLIGFSWLSNTNWLRKAVENKMLVSMGGFSYSLYLIHIPILAFVFHLIVELKIIQISRDLSFVVLLIFGGGSSILFAWAFSRVFETRLWMRLFRKDADSCLNEKAVDKLETVLKNN
jgi:peptidoglycan/LPS O-acetylase OafA/YrhL